MCMEVNRVNDSCKWRVQVFMAFTCRAIYHVRSGLYVYVRMMQIRKQFSTDSHARKHITFALWCLNQASGIRFSTRQQFERALFFSPSSSICPKHSTFAVVRSYSSFWFDIYWMWIVCVSVSRIWAFTSFFILFVYIFPNRLVCTKF